MQPALAGIRVLDVSRIVSGPVCTFYLAALGAEVIRIDAPGGDLTWQVPPFVGPDGTHRGPRCPDDLAMGHLKRERGKASVTLNLETPEGAALLQQLAALSDVLVENFRPGVMDRLGLGYTALAAVNPRLIYCAITGFGQDGPYRDYQGMDMILQAMTGLMAKTGFPDGPPVKAGFTVGDLAPAIFGALGILAALRQREREGCGQFIDVSMFDVLTALIWDEPLDHYADTGVPPRVGNADPRAAPINCYATRDGQVAIVPAAQAHWPRLCAVLERPDWAADPTLATPDQRASQAARLAPAEPLGSSTRRVLGDLLGLSERELDDLQTRGVI